MRKDFRELRVWQEARRLRNDIFAVCQDFPSTERFGLSSQLIRASRSVTANLAEGYGRFHFQETIRFARQARGSLYELLDHFDVATSCGYMTHTVADDLSKRVEGLIRGLNAYIAYLRERKSVEKP